MTSPTTSAAWPNTDQSGVTHKPVDAPTPPTPFDAGGYWVAKFLLQRGLAALYLLAFLVAAYQFRPLCGEAGLLPLADYVNRRAFRERPSLLYLYPSDRLAGAMAWAGVGLGGPRLARGPRLIREGAASPAVT